jgi:hypothetical protein
MIKKKYLDKIGLLKNGRLDLLHKSNRLPLIPLYKAPQHIREGWGGVIQRFLQEVYY